MLEKTTPVSNIQIKKVAIIGAGIMGHGIAQVVAQAGYDTHLMSRSTRGLHEAFGKIKLNMKTFQKKGIISSSKIKQTMDRITGTTNLDEAIQEADFVLETVPEVLELKKNIFKEPGTLLAEPVGTMHM